MTRQARTGGRRGKSDRRAASLKQLPWRPAQNPYPEFELLAPEQLDQIHATSMRLLSEAGIRVMSDKVMRIFQPTGAIIDNDSKTIRIDESIVMQALKTTPRSFTLTTRNRAKQISMGGRHINFGLVAGPPNVHDCINGRRQGNYEDYCNFIRLAHYFNAVQMLGNQVVAPIELPANSRHLDTYNANLTYSDLSFHCSAIGRGRALDGIHMMAISRGQTAEQMQTDPGISTIISINSPRLLDEAMADGLIVMAEFGQPVTITPFTLMGAMTPVTLPAALVQQNAEALFGVVLAQLVNPGTPVMYGSFTSNVDMRSGAPAFGTPENAKANIAGGQLARRYGLPYRTSNATASNAVDLQAAYETMMATWGAVLGGADLIHHAVGWLEGGLTASYEKFILDVEILQNITEFLQPIQFDADELGLDTIKSVPAGGHFFGAEHTLERYETAFYQPLLSDWQNHGNWEAAGAKHALQRATELWQAALRDYQPPPMDAAIRDQLDAYIAKRREQIGNDEP